MLIFEYLTILYNIDVVGFFVEIIFFFWQFFLKSET